MVGALVVNTAISMPCAMVSLTLHRRDLGRPRSVPTGGKHDSSWTQHALHERRRLISLTG